MLSEKIQDAFNKQLNMELYSGYIYLSMSAHFESQNLGGMANWMRTQAREELMHAMRFYNFINERGGRVTLAQVDEPKTGWDSALEAFEDALKHERLVTSLIHGLVDLAVSEKDHAANNFLQWFVEEQVEEENSVQTVVDKLRLVGDHGVALFMLDGELGRRVPEAAAGE